MKQTYTERKLQIAAKKVILSAKQFFKTAAGYRGGEDQPSAEDLVRKYTQLYNDMLHIVQEMSSSNRDAGRELVQKLKEEAGSMQAFIKELRRQEQEMAKVLPIEEEIRKTLPEPEAPTNMPDDRTTKIRRMLQQV